MDFPGDAAPDFVVTTLGPEGQRKAFPLVRSLLPALTLDQWMDFAGRFEGSAHDERGIVALESARGYIHGLFCHSVDPDLEYGRVLAVRHFVALDMGDRWRVARQLLDAMERVARARDCRAIRTQLPQGWAFGPQLHNSILSQFRARGHTAHAVCLVRPSEAEGAR